MALYLSKASPVFTSTRTFFPSDDTLRTQENIKECIASELSCTNSANVGSSSIVYLTLASSFVKEKQIAIFAIGSLLRVMCVTMISCRSMQIECSEGDQRTDA